MRLVNAYDYDQGTRLDVMWDLLFERKPHQNISHKKMPTWAEHKRFIEARPYAVLYFIAPDDDLDTVFGTLYLTANREIGIQVFEKHHGYGVGTKAMEELNRIHKGPFLANINPANEASIAFFEKHGFKHIQNTYRSE